MQIERNEHDITDICHKLDYVKEVPNKVTINLDEYIEHVVVEFFDEDNHTKHANFMTVL